MSQNAKLQNSMETASTSIELLDYSLKKTGLVITYQKNGNTYDYMLIPEHLCQVLKLHGFLYDYEMDLDGQPHIWDWNYELSVDPETGLTYNEPVRKDECWLDFIKTFRTGNYWNDGAMLHLVQQHEAGNSNLN